MPNWLSAPRQAGRTSAAAAGVVSLLLGLAPPGAFAEDASATTHVVQAGETLSDIAVSAGVDSGTLAALNSLDDANLLSVGQAITLPGKPAAAASATAGTPPRTYTVAAGDTLWAVARQLATSAAAMADANHLVDPDRLTTGTQLVVPGGAAAQPASQAPAAAPVPGARPGAASPKRSLLVSYTVQAGETLNQIGHQFETSSDAIAQASGIEDPNRLSVGTVLKVPVPGREHVVQAGETLRDIAAQEKVDLGSLVDFNALDDPQLIHVGQVVLVPPPPNGQTVAPRDQSSSKPDAAQAAAAVSASNAAAAKPAAAAPSPPVPVRAPKPAAPLAVTAPPPGSPTDGLAGAGLKFLGSPYVWGGSSPSGFDCSGFVWYVARQAGKQLSRGMLGEYAAGAHPSRDELKPGDLVFFQNTYSAGLSHNGIYIGNARFVHAADEAVGVTTSSLGTAFWSSHWFGATRLP